MATVSLCMIVRNEEKVLTRCLDSVRGIADEICITDTGSTDKTRKIAQKYGTVQVFPWCDDFSAARNFRLRRRAWTIRCGWMRTMFCRPTVRNCLRSKRRAGRHGRCRHAAVPHRF